jgi:DcaP outer membrane protein
MSSKPPAFTLPSTPSAPASTDPAAKDPSAPAGTNDANPFAGFPGVQDAFSRLLPGNFKDTKYKWYGFVRLDSNYDFHPMGSTDSFVTSTIPVPQGKGTNDVLTPRYTRLGFDTLTPLKDCYDWEVKTRIEMDFFNGNTSGAFGSFPIRLRFAWIDVGPFLVGQAASLFMDYDVFPNILDYEGPPGMVLMRQPIAAVRIPLGDKARLAIGVEQPYSDIQWLEAGGFVVNPGTGIITTPGVPKNIQDLPDLTGNFRYAYDYGHVQVAGILRKIAFQSALEQSYHEIGYGVNVTGSFHPWACLEGVPKDTEGAGPLEKSRLQGQYAWGRGINRYIQDVNGLGLDGVFDPFNQLRLISSTGWFVAYEHWWSDKLASVFTYGQARMDLPDNLPAGTYKAADYASANLIWLPVERLGLGIEFLYGDRENKDGAKGKNYRIQTAVQYRF